MNPKEEAEARLQHTREGVRLKRDLENLDRAMVIIENIPENIPELDRLVDDLVGWYEFKAGVDLTSCFVMNLKCNVKKLESNLAKIRATIVEDLKQWEIRKQFYKNNPQSKQTSSEDW